jgi:hypothetical protein
MEKQSSIILKEKNLIDKFTSLWPNPKTIQEWVSKNWVVSNPVYSSYCGNGFYVFLFGNTEDRDLIFRSGPYFMGFR